MLFPSAGVKSGSGRRARLSVRQKALFDNVPEVAWVKDAEGRFVAVSQRFADACGVSQRRLIGRTDWDIWPGEMAQRCSEQERKVSASGLPDRMAFPGAAGGEEKWTEIVRAPIMGGDGRLIGTMGIARDVSPYRLAALRQRLASRQVIRAREEEKRRLSGFLHDEIGALVMRASTALFMAREELGPREPAALGRLDEARAALSELAGSVRQAACDIRPPLLGVLGLGGALSEMCERMSACSGIRVDCYVRLGARPRVDEVVKVLLYRAAQEAVSNAVKHAAPSAVRVRLASSGGRLALTVSDDGKGFDPGSGGNCRGSGSMGMRIMREEAESMAGEVSVKSSPGFGTCVKVVFPARALGREI